MSQRKWHAPEQIVGQTVRTGDAFCNQRDFSRPRAQFLNFALGQRYRRICRGTSRRHCRSDNQLVCDFAILANAVALQRGLAPLE
jgi:hypothetical protein